MQQFPFALPLLLDGSTGVMLSRAGMPEGVCTEQWVLEHPEILMEIQRAYVRAGSQAVYAPTFSANRVKLAAYGLADSVREMNQKLVAISREAVGKHVLVGGDMTALGLFLKPFGDATFDLFLDVYQEQAEALESAGVDFFIAETLMSLAEARAAVIAVRKVSQKPIFVTITCDEHGRMLSGTPATVALVILQKMGISAFGLNCSVGPDAMLPVVRELAPYARVPLIVKPNAGLPSIENGKAVFSLTPEAFTAHVQEFAACGVGIFGGCCGTDDRHIAALSRRLCEISLQPPVGGVMSENFCACERTLFPFRTDLDFGPRIIASDELADDLADVEDAGAEGYWIVIEDEEGLNAFCESQYLIQKPLLLSSPDYRLRCLAFQAYQGLAVCEKAECSEELAAFGAILKE